MSLRGTLYRCHLFSYAGPQTTGVTSRWLYELEPFDGGEALDGDVLELYSVIERSAHELRPDVKIRFDILEQDFLLTGGLDDKIVSLQGTGAPLPDEGFAVEARKVFFDVLNPGEDFRAYVRYYQRLHPDDFGETILVLGEPDAEDTEDVAELARYHALTWWLTRFDSDIGNSEFYFIVNIDGELEDQSEHTVSVSDERAQGFERARGLWSVQTATRRLQELLSGSFLTGSVSDADARAALDLMKQLQPTVLLEVALRLRLSKRWGQFAQAAERVDLDAITELELRLDPNAGYLAPGDQIDVRIIEGSDPTPQPGSEEYEVDTTGIDLPAGLLRGLGDDHVELVGLQPVEAANAIAVALAASGRMTRPFVRLKFARRGSLYAMHPSKLADPERAFEYFSTWRPDPSDPNLRRRDRRAYFFSYIRGVQPSDHLTAWALGNYFKWIGDHATDDELFAHEPHEIWAEALRDAAKPPPESPLAPFLAISRSVLGRLDRVPPDEKRRLLEALDRYDRWIDERQNDPDLKRRDAVDIWSHFYSRVTIEEVEASVKREIERKKAERPPIDFEAVGKKIDEALRLAQTRIWRMPEPQVAEAVEVSGGIFGFFEEKRGISYLIMPSEAQKVIRDRIARQYLHSIIERATSPEFLKSTADEDFTVFRGEHSDLIHALVLTDEHPDIEKSEFEVELTQSEKDSETIVAFTPILGQIVGVIEAVGGHSLYGRTLGGAERVLVGAASIAPVGGKLLGTGGRLVTASAIARDYRLTMGEANALYRAAFRVRPGSLGEGLVKRLLPEVQAGRPIVNREELRDVARLLQEMGMDEPATARALGLPEARAMQGADLAAADGLERLAADAIGNDARATAALNALSKETRDALRAATQKEPEWLHQTIRRELEGNLKRNTDELVTRMERHGMPQEQSDLLGPAVGKLNAERRAVLSGAVAGVETQRIAEMADGALLRSEGDLLLTELRRRRDAARAAGQTSRAASIERRIARTEQWLSGPGASQAERDLLRQTVAASPRLTEMVATLGAQPTLRRLWIQYRLLQAGRGAALTFEEYADILARHFRGNFGEFEVAFRLGRTHIVLKPPDSLVTLPGADLILIPRTGGDLLLIDNKALSALQVDEVSALTRNLPRNLGIDLAEFSRLANDTDVPAHMQLAINRLTRAQQQLQPIVGGLTKAQIETPAIQAQINAVLQANRIQRVVTNAGGSVQGLSTDLRAIGLDLRNLN